MLFDCQDSVIYACFSWTGCGVLRCSKILWHFLESIKFTIFYSPGFKIFLSVPENTLKISIKDRTNLLLVRCIHNNSINFSDRRANKGMKKNLLLTQCTSLIYVPNKQQKSSNKKNHNLCKILVSKHEKRREFFAVKNNFFAVFVKMKIFYSFSWHQMSEKVTLRFVTCSVYLTSKDYGGWWWSCWWWEQRRKELRESCVFCGEFLRNKNFA